MAKVLNIDFGERVAGLEHDMKNMKSWQQSQNGAIHRVEAKIDKLIFWGLTTSVLFSLGLLSNLLVSYLR